MQSLLNNNWFVSIASSLITLLVVPFIVFIKNYLISLNGVFTGNYIGITRIPRSKTLIIELVKCKHIKNTIKGEVFGIAFLSSENGDYVDKKQHNTFIFSGRVAERLFVVSYNSTYKGDMSAGSLTLYGNTIGSMFSGVWSGLEEGEVVSSNCTWIKSKINLHPKKDYEKILSEAKKYALLEKKAFIIMSDNFSGKTISKGFSL